MIPAPRTIATDLATIPISEVFGPTIQGEGPHTGRRCFFVRTGECNLHCTWCDTPYTWDRTRYDVTAECPPVAIDEVHHRLIGLGARIGDVVVLSGGEPLIHHHRLHALANATFTWHVESNGTIPPPAWWADRIAHTTLSPKIHDQGDPASRRLKDKALAAWARQPDVAWKFVVARWWLPSAVDAQVATIRDLVKAYRIDPAAVWLMPEGTTPGVVTHGTRNLASHAIDNGWNLTTRLHTLVWHDERGH